MKADIRGNKIIITEAQGEYFIFLNEIGVINDVYNENAFSAFFKNLDSSCSFNFDNTYNTLIKYELLRDYNLKLILSL